MFSVLRGGFARSPSATDSASPEKRLTLEAKPANWFDRAGKCQLKMNMAQSNTALSCEKRSTISRKQSEEFRSGSAVDSGSQSQCRKDVRNAKMIRLRIDAAINQEYGFLIDWINGVELVRFLSIVLIINWSQLNLMNVKANLESRMNETFHHCHQDHRLLLIKVTCTRNRLDISCHWILKELK